MTTDDMGKVIIIILAVFSIIDLIIQLTRYCKETLQVIDARKAKEAEALYKRMERERKAAEKAENDRIEITKQLEAVQYQLALLARLDSFRNDDWTDEREVKKALALEKQYNALYTKERKLKSKLSALD